MQLCKNSLLSPQILRYSELANKKTSTFYRACSSWGEKQHMQEELQMIFKLNEHESQDQGLHVSSQSFPRGIFIIGLTGEQVDSSSLPLLTRVETY